MGRNSSTRWGLFNGVLAGALWGIVFLAPALTTAFSPLQLAVGRYLLYGVLAVLLIVPAWQALKVHVDRRAWIALAGLSLLGNLVYFIFLAMAVHWAGGAAAALIVGMVPVLVAVFDARRPGTLPLMRLAPALGLCVAGTLLVAWVALVHGGHGGGGDGAPADITQRLLGLACAVAALLAWTGYSIANVVWMRRYPAISGHGWSLLTGVATGGIALLLLPLALWLGPQGQSDLQWLHFAGICAVLALGASLLGNACWNRATRSLPLSLGGQLIVFETLFALVYGFVWQQRWPGMLEMLAIVLLVGGVALAARAHARWALPQG